ncbi:uncharacterized protein LOC135485287 [Lineus longissimus]|uniref:uncharacterized protein LOC135485287 n=1 Tax=Lineus longissimus TaxID=88925 RepID=UPI00315DFE51
MSSSGTVSKKGKRHGKKSKSHRYDTMTSSHKLQEKQLMESVNASSEKNEEETGRASKWFLTGLFGLANFGMGASTVAIGMILLDLQLLTDTTSSDTAWAFTAKAIGLLLGIAITGFSQSCLHIHILGMSWLFAGSLVALPFCRGLISLVGVFIPIGISYVSIYSVGTICMAALWKQKKSSSLYFITACGYIGYVISPALSYPFTTDYYRNWTEVSTNVTVNKTAKGNWFETLALSNTTMSETIISEIQWKMFTLLAIVGGVVAASGTFIFFSACCFCRDIFQVPSAVDDDSVEEEAKTRHSTGVVCFFILVGGCVQLIGDGQKLGLAESYLKTFLSRHLELTKVSGVIAVTIFTGSHVAWAAFGKYIQRNSGSSVLFFIMVVFNIAGASVLMISDQSFVLFCVGCALIGVGLSAKSACLVIWVKAVIGDEVFIIYTSYLSWAVGDIAFANLIGHLIDDKPFTFVYVIFGGSVAMLLAFVVGHIGFIAVFKTKGQPLATTLRPLFIKERTG